MFDRIQLRLMLGYVGIFALLLVFFGTIVVLGFSRQLSARQDTLLIREARSLSRASSNRGVPADGGGGTDQGEFSWARISPDGHLLDRGASASSSGLPNLDLARRAVRQRDTLATTTKENEDGTRVVSAPVVRSGKVVAVVQVAQSLQGIHDTIAKLLLVLVPIGVASLALSAIGGLFMSTRAIKPARDAFERQRAFVADASHELKTPLTLIRADAQVASRAPLEEDVRKLLDHQLSETDRMNGLLSNLLLLARLDAGRLAVAREPFDLAEVISETANRFETRASARNISLEVEIAGDDLWVRSDKERTGQVLAALVDNALEHTPKGGYITLTGHREGNWSEARVSDTGPGISPENLPHIFDRFYRSEDARSRETGGAGLGLAIARDLARAQGGDLTAENAQGRGAVFRLYVSSSYRESADLALKDKLTDYLKKIRRR